jgi:hypothetical protein
VMHFYTVEKAQSAIRVYVLQSEVQTQRRS